MANNEDINRNDLITPILPSSSDFVNNLPNNPEGHNLEEGIICIQPSPKKKVFTKNCFWKYFIYATVILVFIAISAYIIYSSSLISSRIPNLKICSNDSILYGYLITCIISAYLFSIGNLICPFIISFNNFVLFSELPTCSKAFFVIFSLISIFYCLTLGYNYQSYEELKNMYIEIYHGFDIPLYIVLWIYIIILIGYIDDFKFDKKKNDD